MHRPDTAAHEVCQSHLTVYCNLQWGSLSYKAGVKVPWLTSTLQSKSMLHKLTEALLNYVKETSSVQKPLYRAAWQKLSAGLSQRSELVGYCPLCYRFLPTWYVIRATYQFNRDNMCLCLLCLLICWCTGTVFPVVLWHKQQSYYSNIHDRMVLSAKRVVVVWLAVVQPWLSSVKTLAKWLSCWNDMLDYRLNDCGVACIEAS